MCNFVYGNKAQLALFQKTKFHIQKCNTCRYIEKQSRRICYLIVVQYHCTSLWEVHSAVQVLNLVGRKYGRVTHVVLNLAVYPCTLQVSVVQTTKTLFINKSLTIIRRKRSVCSRDGFKMPYRTTVKLIFWQPRRPVFEKCPHLEDKLILDLGDKVGSTDAHISLFMVRWPVQYILVESMNNFRNLGIAPELPIW